MYALTGCDTVSHLWGIGKVTAIKVLTNGQQLHLLGNETDDLRDVFTEATKFVATCYRSKIKNSMSELCYQVSLTKLQEMVQQHLPTLKSLPPASESFEEHVKHAHFQTAIWKAAVDRDPARWDKITVWVEQTWNHKIIGANYCYSPC